VNLDWLRGLDLNRGTASDPTPRRGVKKNVSPACSYPRPSWAKKKGRTLESGL
jgi:hypothetical protein